MEVFTFVDATHLISKVGLWKERDKAIELKLESLNNKTLKTLNLGLNQKTKSGSDTSSTLQSTCSRA